MLCLLLKQAHDIYQNVAEAKLLVDHMVEYNGLELAQAKEMPDQEQITATNHRHQGEDETEWLDSLQIIDLIAKYNLKIVCGYVHMFVISGKD